MDQGLWQQLKQSPSAFIASIVLHLVLLVIVGISLDNTSAPKLPHKPTVKTVQAVVVDAAKVDAELKKLKLAEKRKKNKEESRKKRLERDAKKARDKRRKEEKRLANLKRKEKKRLADLKRKQKKIAKAEKEKRAKLEKERKKKQKELAALEKKRQQEQQKLAAIEAKRKAEEETARKKKQAKEAEARRLAEAAELKRQMEEEERRNIELNSRVQKLRAQYVQDIMNHVQRYWLKPSNIQKGWKCDVSVQQNALGDVTHVKMLNCIGSDGFKSSVERAVKKASPLPSPKDPKAFDRNIQFTFNPKG